MESRNLDSDYYVPLGRVGRRVRDVLLTLGFFAQRDHVYSFFRSRWEASSVIRFLFHGLFYGKVLLIFCHSLESMGVLLPENSPLLLSFPSRGVLLDILRSNVPSICGKHNVCLGQKLTTCFSKSCLWRRSVDPWYAVLWLFGSFYWCRSCLPRIVLLSWRRPLHMSRRTTLGVMHRLTRPGP